MIGEAAMKKKRRGGGHEEEEKGGHRLHGLTQSGARKNMPRPWVEAEAASALGAKAAMGFGTDAALATMGSGAEVALVDVMLRHRR